MYNQTPIITGIGTFGVCSWCCCCYGWLQILDSVLLVVIAVLLGLLLRQAYKLRKGEKQLSGRK